MFSTVSEVQICTEETYTKVCHTKCLNGRESLHCKETRSLRFVANVQDEVKYIFPDLQNVSDSQDLSTAEEEDDLTDWSQHSKNE